MGSWYQSLLHSVLPRLTNWQTRLCIRLLYGIPGFTRQISRCPVCGNKPDRVEFNTGFSALDHCPDCGHVYTRKTPKKLILQLMYKDFGYWMQDKVHQGITKIEYGPQWAGFINARIGALQRAGLIDGAPRRFFEIGCSEGILLRELENLGHETLGCEMNRTTAESGMRALGVTIMTDRFEELDLPQAYYDVVTSFHTIEHIPDLNRTFAKIVRVLKPDGQVLIEVPTGPEEYPNIEHVQFFSEESLKRLMERYFEIGEIFPNRYTNIHGTMIGSLYGVGRRPKMSALIPVASGVDPRTLIQTECNHE